MPQRADDDTPVQGGLTEAEKRENVISLAFGGNRDRLDEFVRIVREEIPQGTSVVLRGRGVCQLSSELFQNDKIVATATATAVIRKMQENDNG